MTRDGGRGGRGSIFRLSKTFKFRMSFTTVFANMGIFAWIFGAASLSVISETDLLGFHV